jgi:hypothetical protein
MLTTTGNTLTKMAPTIGPTLVFMPPKITITIMFTETVHPNCPGEMKPRKEKVHPARPASDEESPNIATFLTEVGTPTEDANGSASRIARRTE